MIGYRLLGPLEVTVDGHALDVGGLKQRALLAILLLHANQPVPRDVLIDQLWGSIRRPAPTMPWMSISGGCAKRWTRRLGTRVC